MWSTPPALQILPTMVLNEVIESDGIEAGTESDLQVGMSYAESEGESVQTDNNKPNDSEVIFDEEEDNRVASWLMFVRNFRRVTGDLVNDHRVQWVMIVLIIINAIIMGVATFDLVEDDTLEKVDRAFLIIFTIELGMQFIYRGFSLLKDGWLLFDFIIVAFSWGFAGLQIIRAFRVFRIFRLITRVKLLRDLVTAIAAVLPRMAAICALSILVMYIFAVLFTELFSDLPLQDNYFRTLDSSLLTCVELMSLEWANPVREVMKYKTWAWIPFVSYIAIMGFIMFNLILAVVCDAVAVVEKESKELEKKEEQQIPELFLKSQRRINDLAENVSQMMEEQEEISKLIGVFTAELKAKSD